jgi:Ca-activated chloride channel family protein
MTAHGRVLGIAAVLALASLALPSASAQDAERRRGFSIEVTAPPNQSFVFGKTQITASVRVPDPRDIERVEFLVGDRIVFVDKEAPYECFFDFGQKPKSWVVRAVAYHKEGIDVSDQIVTRKLEAAAYVEEVNRVLLWASVTDSGERFVTDLKKEDFRVLENGVEQQILEFGPEERPITMAIVIDTSGSMRDMMKDVHEAANSFVETLRSEDRALVIEFDDKVFLVQDLTADHALLKEAITSSEALGGTSLYDALHAAFRKLKGIDGRKAVVILSDGEDTSSQFPYDRVLEEAKSQNLLIYGIGLGISWGQGPQRGVLKEFSDVTGGRAHFVNKATELAGVYQRIAEELRRQYFIAYSTENKVWDGRWIKLSVDAKDSGLKVRARRGFFAVPNGRQPQADEPGDKKQKKSS